MKPFALATIALGLLTGCRSAQPTPIKPQITQQDQQDAVEIQKQLQQGNAQMEKKLFPPNDKSNPMLLHVPDKPAAKHAK